jgi:hypothetical protein
MRTRPSEPLDQRLWKRVKKTPTCWLWAGGKNCKGYGVISYQGTEISTHRASWIVSHGEIPPGRHVLHKCDVRNCVRPAHLFLGDQISNNADMRAKGRQSRHGGARGVKHWAAKMTPTTVERCRAAYARGVGIHELARRFNLAPSGIFGIVNRTTWKEVL